MRRRNRAMEVTDKKISRQGEDGADRLSSLDDSLLHQILGSVDTVQAVQMCVLSKRWTHLWRRLPTLSFSRSPMPYDKRDHPMYNQAFEAFLTQVLIRRENCRLFKLRFCVFYVIKPCLLESLLDYAFRNGVQDICLQLLCEPEELGNLHSDELFASPCPYLWPKSFVNCHSLLNLELFGSAVNYIRLPKNLVLAALKYLTIDQLHFSKDHADGSFFPSCPNLEYLSLSNILIDDELKIVSHSLRTFSSLDLEYFPPRPHSKVVIVAPKLTTFEYSCCCPMVFSVGVSSLEYVDIRLDRYERLYDSDDELPQNLIQMVNELRVTKSMTINVKAITVDRLLALTFVSAFFYDAIDFELLDAYDKVLAANSSLLDGLLSKFDNLEYLTVQKDSREDLDYFPPCLNNYFLNDATELEFIQPNWELTSRGTRQNVETQQEERAGGGGGIRIDGESMQLL